MANDEAPILTTEERDEARKLRESVGPEWQGAFARARARRLFRDMTPEQKALYQRAKRSDKKGSNDKATT